MLDRFWIIITSQAENTRLRIVTERICVREGVAQKKGADAANFVAMTITTDEHVTIQTF